MTHNKDHVTRNSRYWLVTTGLGACCYAQSIAWEHNAAAYGYIQNIPEICVFKNI